MESTLKERMADSEWNVPDKNKIQCNTCVFADRNPIKAKDGRILVEDRIDYGDCEKYESKPNGVLFPDRNTGKYVVCPNYKSI